jgi:hypothetical protein
MRVDFETRDGRESGHFLKVEDERFYNRSDLVSA